MQQVVEGGCTVLAFQIISVVKQTLIASLTLSTGESAEGVQFLGDRTDQSLLGGNRGKHGDKDRSAALIAAVGATQPLDALKRAMPEVNDIVDALLLILTAQVSVVRLPGSAAVGEYQDILVAILSG